MVGNFTEGMWERWDTWSEMKDFQGSSLNSIGLGSVGSFLYQYIAGITIDEEEVGFKKVIIKPYIGKDINEFEGKINTMFGSITSSWRIKRNTFFIKVSFLQYINFNYILVKDSRTKFYICIIHSLITFINLL